MQKDLQLKCTSCQNTFEIPEADLSLYKKFGIPDQIPFPNKCPSCIEKELMSFRNERSLYVRKCDVTNKEIISIYSQNAPFPVYSNNAWWSDLNDPTHFGKEFDFTKSFFTQFKELMQKVPRLALAAQHNENSDFVNMSNYMKNCYMVFGAQGDEDCAYCWRVHDSLCCFECTQLNDCRYCYECVDCDNCYNTNFSQNSQNCTDSEFLYNCSSCQDCFMCVNLKHGRFCILNKSLPETEYKTRISQLKKLSFEDLENKFNYFKEQHPHKAINETNTESCTGDYLINCKNCRNVFSAKECEDLSNVFLAERAKDCLNCVITGWPGELNYYSISACVHSFMNLFCTTCWTCQNITYCDSCFDSKNLFGCIGMKKASYCILNKQYSEKEYNEVVPKIIDHMKNSNEWGNFFPTDLSPFKYEETLANDYYQ